MIIPLLKETKYLEECLESIANQDIHNFDVLIVRDFPSDKVNEQIMEYAKVYAAKYPINQVECTEEHGLAAARNFGMSKAKGEYITFVDPEDMLEAGTLRALLEAVPNLPVPMVYTRVKPLHPLLSGYHEEYEEEVELLYETDTDRLSKRPAIDQALAVYDRTALQYMVELRDDLEDFTVLGCVFHKSFLKENDIIFDSNIMRLLYVRRLYMQRNRWLWRRAVISEGREPLGILMKQAIIGNSACRIICAVMTGRTAIV